MANLSQKGFGAVEIIVTLALLGLIAAGGYFAWTNYSTNRTTDPPKATNSPAPSVSASTLPQANSYQRTTTIPSDWKTFSNAEYKVSLKYPATMSINYSTKDKKSGEATDTTFSAKATKLGVFCYLETPSSQSCSGIMYAFNASAADAISEYKSTFIGANSNIKLVSESKLTIDGHEATAITYKQGSMAEETTYFISANGFTYVPANVVTGNNTSRMLFEAVSIQ